MHEDVLALRVAARFQRSVISAFISDKWFKAKKSEISTLLKIPMPSHKSEMWAYYLDEKVGDFLTKFNDDFKSIVTFEPALESVARRTNDAKAELKVIVDSLELVCKYPGHVNFLDPAQYLKWKASLEIHDKIAEVSKTLGGFLKWSWTIDNSVVERLVQRTLKVATPEQLASLTSEYEDRIDQVRYNFLASIKFDESALKALKRTKLDKFDPIKWVDWIYATLRANYSESVIQEKDAYREFDMYGMKVVIDDNSMQPEDARKYIKYIDEAHTRMKAKGFEKAWYGTFFIQCERCGGVNHNTGGGVGGHFVIGPDTVSCFERPSSFVVELLAHELGHRYWYKQMTSTQRAKFESLVKVRPTAIRPSEGDIKANPIPEERVKEAHSKVDHVVDQLDQKLELFRKSKLRWFTKIIDAFYEPITKEAWNFKNEIITAVHSAGADSTINPTVKKAFEPIIELGTEIHTLCLHMDDDLKRIMNTYPDGTDFNSAFRVERGKWIDQILTLLYRITKQAHRYLDMAVEAYNKEEAGKGKKIVENWERRYQEDTRPVAPVSDYGGSNIDEAFAEAFAYYVMGKEMTRDQIDSFKSVFSSVGDPLVDLVALRYMQNIS